MALTCTRMPVWICESRMTVLPRRISVEESVLAVTAPRRWSRTTSEVPPAGVDWTSPSISSPACPRGVMTAVEPWTAAVIWLVPETRATGARALISERANSISTVPAGTPFNVKLPEASVTADGPPWTTCTVTPERPISIPWVVAPEIPAPRMTVPETVALPAAVGEEEDSWQEAVRASAASAPSLKAIVLGIGRGVDMGTSMGEGRRSIDYDSDTFSPGFNPCATGIWSLILVGASSPWKNGCGRRVGPFAHRGDQLGPNFLLFSSFRRREQKAVRPKGLRRRGAVCGVAAPPRCAPASPSSRLLASDPAALATPPHTLFPRAACPDCLLDLHRSRRSEGGHPGMGRPDARLPAARSGGGSGRRALVHGSAGKQAGASGPQDWRNQGISGEDAGVGT